MCESSLHSCCIIICKDNVYLEEMPIFALTFKEREIYNHVFILEKKGKNCASSRTHDR